MNHYSGNNFEGSGVILFREIYNDIIERMATRGFIPNSYKSKVRRCLAKFSMPLDGHGRLIFDEYESTMPKVKLELRKRLDFFILNKGATSEFNNFFSFDPIIFFILCKFLTNLARPVGSRENE